MKKIHKPLIIVLCAAMMSGCFGSPAAPTDTTAETSADTSAAVSETAATTTTASAAALASEDEPVGSKEEKPLVIAVSGNNAEYTPFSMDSDFDELVTFATQECLLNYTRSGKAVLNGVTGESELFSGKRYDYSGIADTVRSYDEESDTTTYTFNLRTDVKFADGEVLDADDVIFSLYASLDASTPANIYDALIVGSANYRFNSPIAEELTEEQINEVLASEEITRLIQKKLIIPVLEEQYENVLALYSDNSHDIYTTTYPDPDSLFVFFFSTDSKYEKPEGATTKKIISDIAKGYGNNYRRLAGVAAGDEHAYDDIAVYIAVEYITSQLPQDGESPAEPVNNISGIVKTGKYSVAVTVYGNGRSLEDNLCRTPIMPLHYYGNEEKYDYEANMFGFTRGDLSEVVSSHAGEPMGAGAYTFSEYADGSLILKPNENYYGVRPQTSAVKLVECTDCVEMIADGTADLAECENYPELEIKIEEANKSIEKIYSATVRNYGYGTVNFNTQTVNIAGEPVSEASCALRKALATAISYYKNESVTDYFGTGKYIIEYPCVDGVNIDKNAEYYVSPYSLNVKGEPIFEGEMTDKERTEAVKAACLGFFEKAGYVIYEDKVVEAPEGGRLEFSASYSIPEDRVHPAGKMFANASKLLSEIGITLKVNCITDAGVLYESLTTGMYDIVSVAEIFSLTREYDEIYSKINDEEIPVLVSAAVNAGAEDMQEAYYALFDKVINEYAAEIPMYERTVVLLGSTLRTDRASVPGSMTYFCNWLDEINNIKLK